MTKRHSIVEEDLRRIAEEPLEWERFKGKTVLISGAAGFLPAYMVETLLFLNETHGLGCHVVGLVRNLEKARSRFAFYSERKDLDLVKADVSQSMEILKPCDFIVHAASQASPRFYGTDPVGTMTANLLGTYYLLNLAKQWQSEGFLFFSSSEVYGQVQPSQIPTTEADYGYTDILNPRSCYAESKRAGETMTASFHAQYEVPCKIVRPFHTYGPGMALDDGRVFADFVNDVVQSRNIILSSDGLAVRAFCYLSDATRAFFRVLLHGQSGQAYNVGNASACCSIRELAELLVRLFPAKNIEVEHQFRAHADYVPSPHQVQRPDVHKLNSLGWEPNFSLGEGFARTIDYYSS